MAWQIRAAQAVAKLCGGSWSASEGLDGGIVAARVETAAG
jgi:hypothetical protein